MQISESEESKDADESTVIIESTYILDEDLEKDLEDRRQTLLRRK